MLRSRHLSLLAAVGLLGACASPAHESVAAVPLKAAAPVWGSTTDGLRMRVELPERASRGDGIPVDVYVAEDSAGGDTPTLSWHYPELFVRMRLRPVAGGPEIVLEPDDPSAGMPDPPPPPGEPRERSIVPGARLIRCDVRLAVEWDRLAPGEYDVVVDFAHDGAFSNGGRTLDAFGGTFRGTLVSQPLRLTIGPAPERSLEVRVPAALLGGDVDGLLTLPVRNGFVVGIRYRGGFSDGSVGGVSEGGLQPGMFDDELARIAAARGSPAFTIFETSDAPAHLITPGPGSGHYRVLWRQR